MSPDDLIPEKEPVFTAIINWDPATVRAAEQQADAGSYILSADLSEWISSRDTRVVSALETRFEPPMCLPWAEGSESIGEVWHKICPWTTELSIRRDMLMLGFALVEITPRLIDGKIYPRLWRKNPRFLRLDKQKREWQLRIADDVSYTPIDVNNGSYAILSTKSNDRPWAFGLYRSLARWVLLTQYAIDDCANFSNRHGCGVWVVNQDSEEKRRRLVSELRQMGRNGVVGAPKDSDLKLIESSSRSYEVFFEQLKIAHQEISISIVGANLGMQASAGAGQVANVHLEQQFSRWIIGNNSFAATIQENVFEPFIEKYSLPYEYELPLRDMTKIEDERVVAAARQSNSQAITGAIGAGIKVTQDEARELLFLEDSESVEVEDDSEIAD